MYAFYLLDCGTRVEIESMQGEKRSYAVKNLSEPSKLEMARERRFFRGGLLGRYVCMKAKDKGEYRVFMMDKAHVKEGEVVAAVRKGREVRVEREQREWDEETDRLRELLREKERMLKEIRRKKVEKKMQ